MTTRRQRVSDDEIFEAVQRAMTQHGPHELTLAHIAAEARITPGLLVQRFGGKRELLLAVSQRFAGSAPAMFQQLRAAHREPLATLRAYAACMAELASTPDALSRNLAYLQIDLTDDSFRAHLLENARATRKELRAILKSAMDAGKLKKVDPSRLARTIEAVIGGSLMSWACYRQGYAAAWVRHDLDAVLRPYLTVKRTSVGKRQRRRLSP